MVNWIWMSGWRVTMNWCMAITWKVLVSVLLYLTCKTYLISDVEVIPLQSLSVVDVAGTEVKENEILAHALTNVSQLEQSEGWVIKQSADFINEYPRTSGDGTLLAGTPEDPNHLLGTFPYLFPYTLGGFEVDSPTSVSHESQSHWALHYSDKCFCEDHFFMFQVFSMLQKHQMCAAATLQILKLSFSQHQCAISCLSGIGAYWQWQWWWWQLHCCGIHGLGMYFFPWFIWWLMWHWQSILSSHNIFDNMPDLALISSDVHNELEHCLSTDTEDVKDTLLLWHNHYASFPSLSCMAWDYLSIPGKQSIPLCFAACLLVT